MNGRIQSAMRVISAGAVIFTAVPLMAVQPSDRLLPGATTGYLSVRDVDELTSSWEQTQLGQLVADPKMEPFVNDFKRQLQTRLRGVQDRLGLTLEDLEGVPAGELCIGLMRPADDLAAMAILIDVTDKKDEVDELLGKIDRHLTGRKATKKDEEVLGARFLTYAVPNEDDAADQPAGEAVFFLKDDMLCGCDNRRVALGILGRFSEDPRDCLADKKTYRAVMDRCQQDAGELVPHFRWYVDPFALAETLRMLDPSLKPKRGKDLVAILSRQGFSAIQAIGGYVNLRVDDEVELLHRTAIFAPAVEGRADKEEKYELAGRMLTFPNGGSLAPQAWVPREVTTYTTFNWDIQKAFDSVETLADELIGEPGAFREAVIEGLEEDPYGPQINIRDELIAHLGQHASLITDYELPPTPQSERMLFGVETTNSTLLAKTIERTMEKDRQARRREFHGHVVWEIVEEEMDLPTLAFETPSFDPVGAAGFGQTGDAASEEETAKLPSSAVCVAYDHLFIASHYEFLRKVLVDLEKRETLGSSHDFKLVSTKIDELMPDKLCLRFFSRTDEEYRPTYELIRAGRMPESETMFGKLLNRLLGNEDEKTLRRQELDGDALPDFEMVRRYLGPAGLAIQTEENGWFVLGFTLNKRAQ